MKSYLNLGCGNRYNPEWTNIDFASNHNGIIAHNLLDGIPYENEKFDVVYHSHVLEHFTKKDGESFLKECYRVLKSDGTIRIVVPDLEQIAKEYIKNLELAIEGNVESVHNYDWIMLELYDQVVRNKTGGEMANYLYNEVIPNLDYIYQRIGLEASELRNQDFHIKSDFKIVNKKYKPNPIRQLLNRMKKSIIHVLFKKEIEYIEMNKRYIDIGKFRLSGEIHQWMYDRYSLSIMTEKAGFINIEVKTAFESRINNWSSFGLESKDGIVFKPDSLFIEAVKP